MSKLYLRHGTESNTLAALGELGARRDNSRKNYRGCPHNEGAKNISTEICRLRKEKLQCFPFFLKYVSLGIFERESTIKFPEQHGKILLA